MRSAVHHRSCIAMLSSIWRSEMLAVQSRNAISNMAADLLHVSFILAICYGVSNSVSSLPADTRIFNFFLNRKFIINKRSKRQST